MSKLKINNFNSKKAGIFVGSFFLGGDQFDRPLYFRKSLSNINIALYNC